ncbi:MAG: nickel pincer cofactor biosynthesis protein LarB [Acidobacteria bacterium]|nr:nickel pincer cofactor biosynthesis protein LarB [Acidobacteriota bacterium]
MDQEQLKSLLEQVKDGAVDVDAAIERLRHLPFENLGYATVDHHRAIRTGMPEVIFGKGKTADQVAGIAARLLERAGNVLATRTTPEAFELVRASFPEAEYFPLSGALRVWRDRSPRGKGKLAIVSAGTTDLPVAEEAVVTAEIMGNDVVQVHDVGVAGIHRLFGNFDRLKEARVIVVCAGMEGALPSAVGGLVSCPVIAVPTSVGYGASFHGLAALLGMLNSCASNVSVVNIDNGFGGGYVASLINRL